MVIPVDAVDVRSPRPIRESMGGECKPGLPRCRAVKHWVFAGVVFAALCTVPAPQMTLTLWAQSTPQDRKLRTGGKPDYPELARRMNITGVVRIELTVAPDGSVVLTKEIGGNPVLI